MKWVLGPERTLGASLKHLGVISLKAGTPMCSGNDIKHKLLGGVSLFDLILSLGDGTLVQYILSLSYLYTKIIF